MPLAPSVKAAKIQNKMLGYPERPSFLTSCTPSCAATTDRQRGPAARLCRALSLRAAERLGQIVTGSQQGTVPRVTIAAITILKGRPEFDEQTRLAVLLAKVLSFLARIDRGLPLLEDYGHSAGLFRPEARRLFEPSVWALL
jgi:hypothetical protein